MNASEWIANLADPRTFFDDNRTAKERTTLGLKSLNRVIDVCDRPIAHLPARHLSALRVCFMKAEERFSTLEPRKSGPVELWREAKETAIPRGHFINVRDEKNDRMN